MQILGLTVAASSETRISFSFLLRFPFLFVLLLQASPCIPHKYDPEDFAVFSQVFRPSSPIACMARFVQNQDSPGLLSIFNLPPVCPRCSDIPFPAACPPFTLTFFKMGVVIGSREVPSVRTGASSTRVQHRPSAEARCKHVRTTLLFP